LSDVNSMINEERLSEPPPLNDNSDLDAINNLKMPVKQFYERSGMKGDPSQLSVSPFSLQEVFQKS
jgi:hypothetical protein